MISGAIPSQAEMLKMIFPLPEKELAVGDSSTIPSKMPFNAYGSLLWITGDIKITLRDYVSIENVTCARFDVKVDISKIDVPEELGGEYKCSTKGTGVLYFEMEDRCFHSGAIAVIVSMRVSPPKDSPMPASTSMDSDNLLKFTRNMAKEKEANK